MSGESITGERANGDTGLDEWREDVEYKLRENIGLGERFEDKEQAERFASTVERETVTLIEDLGMGFDQGFGEMRRLRELTLPAYLDSWFSAHVTAALARNGHPAEANEVVENEVFILEDEHKAVARFGIAEGYAHQDEIEEAHTQLELVHVLSSGFDRDDLEAVNSIYSALFQARSREADIPILGDEHSASDCFSRAEEYAHQDEIEEAHNQLELAHMSGGGFSEGDLEGLNGAYNAVYQAKLRDLGIPNPVSSE